MRIEISTIFSVGRFITDVGPLILSVAGAITGAYVIYRAARTVLLLINGGVAAYREDFQLRRFERRYKAEERRRAQKINKWAGEMRYREWKRKKEDPTYSSMSNHAAFSGGWNRTHSLSDWK